MGRNLSAKKVKKLNKLKQNKFDRVLARNIEKHGDDYGTKGKKALDRIDKDEVAWNAVKQMGGDLVVPKVMTKKQLLRQKMRASVNNAITKYANPVQKVKAW
jgi:hypothetical protein